METKHWFVERIEAIRKAHKLNASSFATKLGVTKGAYSRFVSNPDPSPSSEFLGGLLCCFPESIPWVILLLQERWREGANHGA